MNEEMTFETKLERLKTICQRLEENALSLDEVMKLYEEGSKLSSDLQKELDAAIKRYEDINTNEIITKSE